MKIINFKGGFLISTFAGLIMCVGLLPWFSSLAKTTVTADGDDGCSFKVKVQVAFAFLDDGSKAKADDLLKTWGDEMAKIWNGPNGHQTFGDCGCKVTFEFDLKKLPEGTNCLTDPGDYHCIHVVDRPVNQRGNRADAHTIPPTGVLNGYGEWTAGIDGLIAAHEAGHLMGLDDEYHYDDTNGDGKPDTYVNDNLQVDADGKPKEPQSIMAQTWSDVAAMQSHIDEIMKDAGKECPGKCCCGNGEVDDNGTVTEQCDYEAKPTGCEETEKCNEECKCIGEPDQPQCGDKKVTAPEECDDAATPTGCPPDKECNNCQCEDKPEPPAPPDTPIPEPPAETGDGETAGTDGQGEADDGEPEEDADEEEDDESSVQPHCGDELCESPYENCSDCPEDCGSCPPECGNDVCEDGEGCDSCLEDCPCAQEEVCVANECIMPECFNNDECDDDSMCTYDFCRNASEGDAYCSHQTIEICESGDGCCPSGCNAETDPDCPDQCGDGVCTGNETCDGCPSDCGSCLNECGDGVCESGETCESCEADCGSCYVPACDDGLDNDLDGLIDFPQDPGCTFPEDDDEHNGAEPVCGDGLCEYPENLESCSADCKIDN